MSTTQKERYEVLHRLDRLGISYDDANALRRISLTLRRWFELECGDGNDYGSWGIERDEETDVPYMVHHHYRHGDGKDTVSRHKIADREKGARTRLSKIMERYPSLIAYIQTDPRGCALYLVKQAELIDNSGTTLPIDCYYSRGLAVY